MENVPGPATGQAACGAGLGAGAADVTTGGTSALVVAAFTIPRHRTITLKDAWAKEAGEGLTSHRAESRRVRNCHGVESVVVGAVGG